MKTLDNSLSHAELVFAITFSERIISNVFFNKRQFCKSGVYKETTQHFFFQLVIVIL